MVKRKQHAGRLSCKWRDDPAKRCNRKQFLGRQNATGALAIARTCRGLAVGNNGMVDPTWRDGSDERISMEFENSILAQRTENL